MNSNFIDYPIGTPIILRQTLAHPELRLGIVCEPHSEIVLEYFWQLTGKRVYYNQEGEIKVCFAEDIACKIQAQD